MSHENSIESLTARLDVNETALNKLLDVLGTICTCHPEMVYGNIVDHRYHCLSKQIRQLQGETDECNS